MEPRCPNNSSPPSSIAVLIVEGGAMRGIFTTGVLDGFLEAHFNPLDFYLGVSSGAANRAAYLADMPKRNFRIYTDFPCDRNSSTRRDFIAGPT